MNIPLDQELQVVARLQQGDRALDQKLVVDLTEVERRQRLRRRRAFPGCPESPP